MEVGILPCILLLIVAKDDDVIELRPAALPLWVLTTILEVPPAGTVWPLSTIPPAVNQTTIIDHRIYVHNLSCCELNAWKTSRLNGIQTHDFRDTCPMLYQLNYPNYP